MQNDNRAASFKVPYALWHERKRGWFILRCIFAFALLATYFAAAAGRQMTIRTYAIHDGQLFTDIGISLASGHWLGPYNERTLIKGMGYPLFLAVGHFFGIPINLFQCFVYFSSAYYFCRVIFEITSSKLCFWLLLVGLIWLPPLYDAASSSILREVFYSSLVLACTALLFELTILTPSGKSIYKALLFGVIAALFWLTREEGIWMLPGVLALLLLVGLKSTRFAQLREFKIKVASLSLGIFIAVLLVLSVGMANRLVYGRFEINEIKGKPFQSALRALEKASFQQWRPYIPVPREARMNIYRVSPTFAKLRTFFDPEQGSTPWQFGCSHMPDTCGDIAGGWFLFALRDGAAKIGVHENATKAASFYEKIRNEVERACRNGQLICATYLPPLIPPFTKSQLKGLPQHFANVASLLLLQKPLRIGADVSHIDADRKEQVLNFLNYPPYTQDSESLVQTDLRDSFQQGWLSFIKSLQPVYRMILYLGIISYITIAGWIVWRKQLPPLFIVSTVLLVYVISRLFLLMLVDAFAFPVTYTYVLPAMPLAVAFAITSITCCSMTSCNELREDGLDCKGAV
jgi:hypothetical protein